MKRALLTTVCALWLLASLLIPSALVAQAAVPPGPQKTGSGAGTMMVRAPKGWEQRSGALTANQILKSKMEVLDFRDAELQDVVRLIAAKSGLNILMNPAIVQGKVTIHLENVQLGVALDNILRIQKLGFVVTEEENIVRIVQESYLGRTGIETLTEVIPLRYLDAERFAKDLQILFVQARAQSSKGGGGGEAGGEQGLQNVQEQAVGISYHRESNALLITAPPPIMADIKAVIAALDKPENKVGQVKTSTVHVNWLDAVELTDDLKKLYKDQDTKDEKAGEKFQDVKIRLKGIEEAMVRIVAQKASNSIIVTAPSPQYDDILRLIKELDVPQQQVQIQARLVDMTQTAARDLGSQFSIWRRDRTGVNPILVDPTGSGLPADTIGTVNPLPGLAAGASAFNAGYGDVVQIFNQNFDVAAYIQALETRQMVEVLANPRVVTMNKMKAEMNIETEIPYVTVVPIGGGNQQAPQVNFKNAGIVITVTPTITSNGYVRMAIETKQSIQTGVSQGVPVIDVRKTKADVIVSNKDTILTGGLRQFRTQDSTSGTPWFQQIPVLGWLFKSKGNSLAKNELFLFVTPAILESTLPSPREQGMYDRIDDKWPLPDYFFDDVKTLKDMD
jgi:type II secretory pathway component GspD/PulD (secretin)